MFDLKVCRRRFPCRSSLLRLTFEIGAIFSAITTSVCLTSNIAYCQQLDSIIEGNTTAIPPNPLLDVDAERIQLLLIGVNVPSEIQPVAWVPQSDARAFFSVLKESRLERVKRTTFYRIYYLVFLDTRGDPIVTVDYVHGGGILGGGSAGVRSVTKISPYRFSPNAISPENIDTTEKIVRGQLGKLRIAIPNFKEIALPYLDVTN